MKTYVKLVRPDYSSFYDPAFKWPIKGIVEVKNVSENGPCGPGLHLGVSVEKSLQYAKFPFRILKVKPLSPILGQDDSKIRVAKAESLGELPIPTWASDLECRIKALPEEMKVIPWWRGTDSDTATKLIRSHFKLLVPFGFKLDFEIEILTDRQEADTAWGAARGAARDAAWGAARDAAWGAARDAAWGAARDAARDAAWGAAWDTAWGAARGAAWDAAWDTAWDAAWGAAWDTAWGAARGAAWDASGIKKPNPFKPLWECWKLGVWPIGFVGNTFKIYCAKKEGKKP